MELKDIPFAVMSVVVTAMFLLLIAEKLRDMRRAAAAERPGQLPMEVKQVLAVKPEAAEELVRANPYLFTVENCRKMLSTMPDHEAQEQFLCLLLGRALVRQPAMAYVVRLGLR